MSLMKLLNFLYASDHRTLEVVSNSLNCGGETALLETIQKFVVDSKPGYLRMLCHTETNDCCIF